MQILLCSKTKYTHTHTFIYTYICHTLPLLSQTTILQAEKPGPQRQMGISCFHEPLGQKGPVWGRDIWRRKHFTTLKDYQLHPGAFTRRAFKKDPGAGRASPLRHKKSLRFCDRTGRQNLTLSFMLDTEAWKFPTLGIWFSNSTFTTAKGPLLIHPSSQNTDWSD